MRILSESVEPAAKVAEVARRNDVVPRFLFGWQ
jgi:transposase-like protein